MDEVIIFWGELAAEYIGDEGVLGVPLMTEFSYYKGVDWCNFQSTLMEIMNESIGWHSNTLFIKSMTDAKTWKEIQTVTLTDKDHESTGRTTNINH